MRLRGRGGLALRAGDPEARLALFDAVALPPGDLWPPEEGPEGDGPAG